MRTKMKGNMWKYIAVDLYKHTGVLYFLNFHPVKFSFSDLITLFMMKP